ncbi:MAG: ATP-binding protein [Chitinophagales bacterium]|nr:ATP-binding protein [Chitinophagales bacterium]
METSELLKIIQGGETTTVQFKERVDDAYKIGTEIVAFMNTKGGRIIVGIEDTTGKMKGLTYKEIEFTNNIFANAADNNVKPSVFIETESIVVDNQTVLVISIPESYAKPVMDNKGIV